MSDNYFADLFAVDVSSKVEKKGSLSYLSWAWAWAELKKRHPDANAKVYENADGWNYFTDGKTGWVKTGVTVNGLEHIEYLPIMNNTNKSIPLANITSFDVNKAIQRSMTKAIGRHGLGLSIYAGEDVPEEAHEDAASQTRPNEYVELKDKLIDWLNATPRVFTDEQAKYAENAIAKRDIAGMRVAIEKAVEKSKAARA